jgi:hypothetical protein
MNAVFVLLLVALIFVGSVVSFVLAPIMLANNGAGLQTVMEAFAEALRPSGHVFSGLDYGIFVGAGGIAAIVVLSTFQALVRRLYFGTPPQTGREVAGFIAMMVLTYFLIVHGFACAYLGLVDLDRNSIFVNGKPPEQGIDIITAYYFSLATLATVGYGDIYPATSIAKLVVMAEIMAGVGYTVFIFAVVASFIRGRSA